MKQFIYVILVFAALTSSVSCERDDLWTRPGDDNEPGMPVRAPDFKLVSTERDTVSLSQLKEKVVVLFFFGHNCPPCRTAAVNIESKLNQPFRSRNDFVLAGLEVSNAGRTAVESFRSLTGVTFPLLMNASYTANAYETTLDRLIIVDRKGYIHYKSNMAAGCDIDNVYDKVSYLFRN